MNILFMCVANSARSQLAEGLAKDILGTAAWIESAGSAPKTVNRFATQALAEIGVDISSHKSKAIDDLPPDFVSNLDYIITLCAEEVCPVLPSKTAKKLHWPFSDPAGHQGSEQEQLARFREVRENIRTKILEFAQELRNK
jgi:arsenate reductase